MARTGTEGLAHRAGLRALGRASVMLAAGLLSSVAAVRPASAQQCYALQISLEWDDRSQDLDLHVFEPDDTHVWYRHLVGSYGDLKKDTIQTPDTTGPAGQE